MIEKEKVHRNQNEEREELNRVEKNVSETQSATRQTKKKMR